MAENKIDNKYFLLAAIVIAVALIGYAGFTKAPITGDVATTENVEIATDWAVNAWATPAERNTWGDCSKQDGGLAGVNSYCIYKGYTGAASSNPCYYSRSSQRWHWNGASPMVKGTSTGVGMALTKIKCQQPMGGTCTDSDVTDEYPDGKNYYVKGAASYSAGAAGTDYCRVNVNNVLVEFFCYGGGSVDYTCPSGTVCSDGACVSLCTGTPRPCSYYTDQSSCGNVGCTWG